MDRKVKIGAIGVLLAVALFATYIAGFYSSVYYRNANLHLDVGTYSVHIQVWVERADGTVELIKDGVALNNDGVLTNIGKDWIENQLGDTPSTDPAKWISLSTDSSTPDASWTQIPNELTSDGLSRAAGTYSSTGTGQWKIEHQFTATGTVSNVQLTGLHWASSGDNNLLSADTFTPVTLNDGDKLTITWTITVS